MSAVNVIAVMKVKEDKATWVWDNVIKELVTVTRQEHGVVTYEVSADAKNPHHFIFVEQYKSMADMQSHSKSAHFAAAIKKISPFLTSPPDIKLLKPLLW